MPFLTKGRDTISAEEFQEENVGGLAGPTPFAHRPSQPYPIDKRQVGAIVGVNRFTNLCAMEVFATRVPASLGQKIQQHCRGLGKTPSQWIRELIEEDLEGKPPTPALGEALEDLTGVVLDNGKLMSGVMAVCLGIYKTLAQIQMLDHPERAADLEKAHRELLERALSDTPARGQLTIDTGLKISDLASEVERLKAEKQTQ